MVFYTPAVAETTVTDDVSPDTIIVSGSVYAASRSQRDIDSLPESVSLVTSKAIEARAPVNIQEMLDTVPGVSYSRAGGLGGQISFRGFNSNDSRTLVVVDGDRFRGRNTLEFNLIDPAQIERIEIIRGPGASAFGSDAMNGVINIVTRRASGADGSEVRVTPLIRALDYNSQNSLFGVRSEVQAAGKGLDVLFGVSYRHAQDTDTPLGQISNSDFETIQVDGRIGYQFAPTVRIEAIGKYVRVESGRAGGIGGSPGAPLIVLREDPVQEKLGKIAISGSLPSLSFDSFEASLYVRELYSELRTVNNTSTTQRVETTNIVDGPVVWGGKLIAGRELGPGNLTIGADFFVENRTGAAVGRTTTRFNSAGTVTSVVTVPIEQNTPNSRQSDIGTFIRYDLEIADRLLVSASGRYDRIVSTTELTPILDPLLDAAYRNNQRNVSSPLTGELGLIFKVIPEFHLLGNIGTAYRVPSTIESFGSSRQGTGFNVPNPDLQPEKSTTYEIGARLRLNGLSANLVAFQSEFSNFIQRQAITFQGLPSFTNVNVGEARMRGIEFDLAWQATPSLWVTGNLAYLRGDNTTTNQPLPYVAPLNGRTSIRFAPAQSSFHVEGELVWSTDKDRIFAAQERATDGYAVVNLFAGADLGELWRAAPRMSINIGIANLFNKTYRLATTQEDIAYPRSISNSLIEPGRSLRVSLRSSL